MTGKKEKPRSDNFDQKNYAWRKDIDYRARPDQYRVGKGEQGVLICEPYKGEIGAHWRFKTPDIARESAQAIFAMFDDYLDRDDFVGADMARKYLQMGYTRARRYANYKGGRKYKQDDLGDLYARGTGDPEKAESASIFYDVWQKAEADSRYAAMKKDWKKRYG